MLTVRFLFGMGEAGASRTSLRAFHNWFPFTRTRLCPGSSLDGGPLRRRRDAVIVLALLFESNANGVVVTHWRHSFWIFGSMALSGASSSGGGFAIGPNKRRA